MGKVTRSVDIRRRKIEKRISVVTDDAADTDNAVERDYERLIPAVVERGHVGCEPVRVVHFLGQSNVSDDDDDDDDDDLVMTVEMSSGECSAAPLIRPRRALLGTCLKQQQQQQQHQFYAQ